MLSPLGRKMINAKVLLDKYVETIIGLLAISFECCMGKVDGNL